MWEQEWGRVPGVITICPYSNQFSPKKPNPLPRDGHWSIYEVGTITTLIISHEVLPPRGSTTLTLPHPWSSGDNLNPNYSTSPKGHCSSSVHSGFPTLVEFSSSSGNLFHFLLSAHSPLAQISECHHPNGNSRSGRVTQAVRAPT
jgi:hypothetical protein